MAVGDHGCFDPSRRFSVVVSRESWCGLRAVRVGEASHPGRRTLRRLRRGSVPTDAIPLTSNTQVEVSSHDEPLVRPNSGSMGLKMSRSSAWHFSGEGVDSTVPASILWCASAPARASPLLPSGRSGPPEFVVAPENALVSAFATQWDRVTDGLSDTEKAEKGHTEVHMICMEVIRWGPPGQRRRLTLRSGPTIIRTIQMDTPDSHDQRVTRVSGGTERNRSPPISCGIWPVASGSFTMWT